MKKHLKLMTMLLVAVLLTALMLSGLTVLAQGESNLRVNVNIAPGELIVYAPPDFTTPVYAWAFNKALERGYSYESTFRVANTSLEGIDCAPHTVNMTGDPVNIEWADISITPESFWLAPGESEDVHLIIWVHPDAPIESTFFDIDFREP